MFKVERNVPITPQATGRPAIRASLYPFAELNVGDSFAVTTNNPQKIRSAAHHWGKTLGRVFQTRLTDEGIRCWRVK